MKPFKIFLFVLSTLFILLFASLLLFDTPLSCFSSTQPVKECAIPNSPAADNTITSTIDKNYLCEDIPENVANYPFQYNDSNISVLYPFFEILSDSIPKSPAVHIAHFGDSQIEGDRITSTIRQLLQKYFKGNGIGLLPITSPVQNPSLYVDISKEWEKKSITTLPHKKNHNLGINMGYTYLGNLYKNGHITLIKPSKTKYPCPILGIITNRNVALENIDVSNSQKAYTKYQQHNDHNLQRIDWKITDNPRQVKIHCQNTDFFPIYALIADDTIGITVDNIPLRGNSGVDFIFNNDDFMNANLNLLNVKLIILQFGINAIPRENIIIKNFNNYRDKLYAQLIFFKQLAPNIPIIVIGVSDRAIKQGYQMESNPNIIKLRDAQKEATLNAGCVFWDLFEAMGGTNSAISWHEQQPKLINNDYIHFSDKGAELVGLMFYQSLITEYKLYLQKQKNLNSTYSATQ